MTPESPEQLIELVRDSAALSAHLSGPAPEGSTIVDLSKLSSVIDYPAADMTITVQSGLMVTELQRTLSEHKQHLPIDVPRPDSTTIGDAVAWNLSGSRRFGYGTFRDHLIGVTAVDGQGRLFKSGGRVVKNVAGYDICKLLIGSRGTLAIITELTFKVLPQPSATGGVSFDFDDLAAMDAVLEPTTTSATRPRLIDIVAYGSQHVLMFGFDGTTSEVAWQQERIRQEIDATGTSMSAERVEAHLHSTSQLHTPAKDRFKAGLRPSIVTRFLQQSNCANVVAHAGNGIVVGETASLHAIKAMAEGLGGWCEENDAVTSVVARTPAMERIRQTFDPDNKLNPLAPTGRT